MFRSPWPVDFTAAQIDDKFAFRSLIKELTRSVEYNILLLSQSGVHLYETINDTVVAEVKNGDFPFKENPHYHTNAAKASDSKSADDQIREFLNKVDKAAVSLFNTNRHPFVVVCTENNYSRLMQVADKPSIYLGYTPINYNDTNTHTLSAATWNFLKDRNVGVVKNVISEIQEAAGNGKILTDIGEIYRAVKEGRGDLLIAHNNFSKAAIVGENNTLTLVDDPKTPGAIDDITGEIAKEVISKKGEVIFTSQEDFKSLGEIVLKVRY